MADNKDVIRTPEAQVAAMPDWAQEMYNQMNQSLRVMAEALRSNSDSVALLKQQMDQMIPLTKAQVAALGKQIRQRAADLCEQYGLPSDAAKMIAMAIRKDVKLSAGTRNLDELPRSLYGVYSDQVAMWDSYEAMRAIKRKSATF